MTSAFDSLTSFIFSYIENIGSSQAPRWQKHPDAAVAPPFSRTLGTSQVSTPQSRFPSRQSNCQGYSFTESLYQNLRRRSVALVNLRMIRMLNHLEKVRERFWLLKSLGVLTLCVWFFISSTGWTRTRSCFSIAKRSCAHIQEAAQADFIIGRNWAWQSTSVGLPIINKSYALLT